MEQEKNDLSKAAAPNGTGERAPALRERKPLEEVIIARPGRKVRLSAVDSDAKAGWSKRDASRKMEKLRERLAALQQALFAEHQRSLLVIFQAMDTGGKDGSVKNLCSAFDPHGVQVTDFKYPSPEEWDHDFLWRIHKVTPRKGMIGIWNRSHYEDVLVPRVHKQITKAVWRERCEDINAFEKLLGHNGVTMCKFFLHISREEQKERLEGRLKDPKKVWKFNPADLKDRALWDSYQRAYEDAINCCATEDAPWHIVPANRKWVRNVVVLEEVVKVLEKINPQYPVPEFDPATVVVT